MISHNKPIMICPSILAADFRHLEADLKKVVDAGADQIHCDIMDGHFVRNISFGPFIVEAVKKCVDIPLDVHLMISNPGDYIGPFCDAGADLITFHAELDIDVAGVIDQIRQRNVKAGLAINPDKSEDLIVPHLSSIDHVLIMTVFAGFGGQKFIEACLEKISAVSRCWNRPDGYSVQVDGGVDEATAQMAARHGANNFVAGTYIFRSPDYHDRIARLRKSAAAGLREFES